MTTKKKGQATTENGIVSGIGNVTEIGIGIAREIKIVTGIATGIVEIESTTEIAIEIVKGIEIEMIAEEETMKTVVVNKKTMTGVDVRTMSGARRRMPIVGAGTTMIGVTETGDQTMMIDLEGLMIAETRIDGDMMMQTEDLIVTMIPGMAIGMASGIEKQKQKGADERSRTDGD